MEKQPLTRSAFFWADGVIAAVSLVWTAHYLGDIYDGLSFGGFFALFLLLILFPYFLALGAALLLLWMSARTGRRVLAGIAAGVQLLSPIPWLWLNYAMEYTASPFEVMMLVCAGAGMFLLLTLAPVRPTRNGM